MESPGKMHMRRSWKVEENHFHYSVHTLFIYDNDMLTLRYSVAWRQLHSHLLLIFRLQFPSHINEESITSKYD